jgi:hypothetical protein
MAASIDQLRRLACANRDTYERVWLTRNAPEFKRAAPNFADKAAMAFRLAWPNSVCSAPLTQLLFGFA